MSIDTIFRGSTGVKLLGLRVKCWSKGWDAHETQPSAYPAKAIDFVLHLRISGQ